MFVGGDFIIDLLNPNKHKTTDNFILYIIGLHPKITRPSRIITHSAILIDNIFSNKIDNKTVSWLLINDISDHLPVFTVYIYNSIKNKTSKIIMYII